MCLMPNAAHQLSKHTMRFKLCLNQPPGCFAQTTAHLTVDLAQAACWHDASGGHGKWQPLCTSRATAADMVWALPHCAPAQGDALRGQSWDPMRLTDLCTAVSACGISTQVQLR